MFDYAEDESSIQKRKEVDDQFGQRAVDSPSLGQFQRKQTLGRQNAILYQDFDETLREQV